jgi:hypothetical protein
MMREIGRGGIARHPHVRQGIFSDSLRQLWRCVYALPDEEGNEQKGSS